MKIEIYWSTKQALKLTIEGRLRPNTEEKDSIYQMLKLHGIDYEEMQEIE